MKILPLLALLALPLAAADELAVTVDREGHFVVEGGAVDRHALDGKIRTRAKVKAGEVSQLTIVATCDREGASAGLLDLIMLGAENGVAHYRVLLGDAEATLVLPDEGGARMIDREYPGYACGRDAEEVYVHLCGSGDTERHLQRWNEEEAPKSREAPIAAATRAWVNEDTASSVDPSQADGLATLIETASKEWAAVQSASTHRNQLIFSLRVDGNVPVKHLHAVLLGLAKKGIAPSFALLPSPVWAHPPELAVEINAQGAYRIDGAPCKDAALEAELTGKLEPSREGWNNAAQLTLSADPSTCAGAVIRVMKIAAQSDCRYATLVQGDRQVTAYWQMSYEPVKGKDGRPVPPRKTTLSLCATADAEDHAGHWAEHSSRLDKAPVAERSYVWWGPPPGAVVKGSPDVYAQIARQLDIEESNGEGARVNARKVPTRIPEDNEVVEEEVSEPTIPLIVLLRVDPNVPYRDLFALLDALSNSALHPQWADGG